MKYLLYILILLMLITPVSAITYPKEHYDLEQKAQIQYTSYETISNSANSLLSIVWGCSSGVRYLVIKSQQQTILMEKQNELLEEQNGLLRNVLNRTYTTECISGACAKYNIVPAIEK